MVLCMWYNILYYFRNSVFYFTIKMQDKKFTKKKGEATTKKATTKKVAPKKTVNKYKTVPENVLDKDLYLKVKGETKKRFSVWPSAYASAYMVKEYKKRGGRYKGRKKNKESGLKRWFDEKWIDICESDIPKTKNNVKETGKMVKCGRPRGGYDDVKYERKYPYCRPLVRINKNTPKTVGELSTNEIKMRCEKKRKSPQKRVLQ